MIRLHAVQPMMGFFDSVYCYSTRKWLIMAEKICTTVQNSRSHQPPILSKMPVLLPFLPNYNPPKPLTYRPARGNIQITIRATVFTCLYSQGGERGRGPERR